MRQRGVIKNVTARHLIQTHPPIYYSDSRTELISKCNPKICNIFSHSAFVFCKSSLMLKNDLA